MRLISGMILSAALAVSAPALATLPAGMNVGMQVTDVNGGFVGTVTAIQGDNLMVKTDRNEVLLPSASFAPSNGKLLFAMTQAQLNAEIDKSVAAAQASVAVGATVKGLSGTDIGKIDTVDDSSLVIALPSGQKIQLSRAGARGNPDGTVTVGLTAEQLEAQVKPAAAETEETDEPIR